ncbi:CD9 antigen-like isoform X1 [Stegodyphus dumicola]|uniref:CD9 antigen-like isoform X1 n=1 Tax=Stegodyphus dumicola TaxID=202533 RepID=UPI0015ADCE3E|nr:CD9 antigen-like isoform X1 [Stegodyphus dumicola]
MGLIKIEYQYLEKFHGLKTDGRLAGVILFIVLETLAGVALLSLSIWMYVDTASYLATDHNDKFFISIYILMAAGSLMTLVGFLGCCGAMQESSCMLGSFSTFVILIFAAEIAGAVYGYSHQDEVKKAITKRVTNMIKNEYSVQDAVTLAVDKMQEKFQCCGASGIGDWSDSSFNKKLRDGAILAAVQNLAFKVPHSCCVSPETTDCDLATSIGSLGTYSTRLHSDGCLKKIEEKVTKHLFTIIVVGISIAIIQIFGFVFSLVLCCAVSGRDY